MKAYKSLTFCFLAFIFPLWPASAITNPPPIPNGFILGISQCNEDIIPVLKQLNIHWMRIKITWKELTPEVVEPSLRLTDVQGKPEQVRRLSQHVNWSPVDKRLLSILQRGIRPIVIVGHGYFTSHAKLNGKPACPDLIGREKYLAQMYWTTRAIVERYDGDGIDDAPGIVIKVWQMENELNEAALTAVWGCRQPVWLDGLSSAWADWTFLTRLLQTIYHAVKDADPEALTLMNFHTDVPAWISWLAGGHGWLDAVREWRDYMDIIGMDAYPNYFNPEPLKGEVVGARVAMIKKTATGLPVFVIETDYPSGPSVLGFTPENQAKYIRASFQSARNAGADAYFKFHVTDPSGLHKVTITDTDVERIKWIRQCVKNRRWLLLSGWALIHANYIKSHFLDILKVVEKYCGVFTPDGQGTAAFNELKRIAATESNEP